MRFGIILALILAVVAVVFALQNPQSMEVNLLVFQTEGSTALVLILTFAFGVLVGLISSLPGRLRTRRKLKELQRKRDQGSSSGGGAGSSSEIPPNPERGA